MKHLFVALALLVYAGIADRVWSAENDATGTWMHYNPRFKKNPDMVLKLKVDGEKLTGSIVFGNKMEFPIEEGTFKGSVVSFKVFPVFNGNKLIRKYIGTVSGDTIKGKIEFDRDGQSESRDWEAEKVK